MPNQEIPDAALIIVERLKAQGESEETIRAALAEFNLSEKQFKQLRKKSQTGHSLMTVGMGMGQRRYLVGRELDLYISDDENTIGSLSLGNAEVKGDRKETVSLWLRGFIFIVAGTALLAFCMIFLFVLSNFSPR